jgi:hypothetical protein
MSKEFATGREKMGGLLRTLVLNFPIILIAVGGLVFALTIATLLVYAMIKIKGHGQLGNLNGMTPYFLLFLAIVFYFYFQRSWGESKQRVRFSDDYIEIVNPSPFKKAKIVRYEQIKMVEVENSEIISIIYTDQDSWISRHQLDFLLFDPGSVEEVLGETMKHLPTEKLSYPANKRKIWRAKV